jgi:hypothetical protein
MKSKCFVSIMIFFAAAFLPFSPSQAITSAGVSIESQAELHMGAETVSSETSITTVMQMYGGTIEPIAGNGYENAGVVHYFPHTLSNLGNGTDNFSFYFSLTSPATWEYGVISDDNANGIHDEGENTPVNSPIVVAEEGQKKFFVTIRIPTSELTGAIGISKLYVSGEGHDGGYYNGANGTIYGGPDTIEVTDIVTVETIRALKIFRDDALQTVYLTWLGGLADIYCISTTFDATFANATKEASGVASPYTCASTVIKDGKTRFYKAAMAGSVTYAPEIVGKFDVSVTMDATVQTTINQLSSPFIVYSTEIRDVVGTQVYGASMASAADGLWRYNPNVTGSYEVAWLRNNGLWYTGTNPTTIKIGTDEGWHIIIRQNHPATYLTMVGEVSRVNRTVPVTVGRNYVGTCFPVIVSLEASNLMGSGMTGASAAGSADQTQRYNCPGRIRYSLAKEQRRLVYGDSPNDNKA